MYEVKLITAVINPEMYHRFFTDNTRVNRYPLIGIDNQQDNRGLPAIYNEIIEDHKDTNCWLFFVHEDFEIKSEIDVLDTLDRNTVYGTFGINLENNVPVAYGRHICSEKDGSHAVETGIPASVPVGVQTIDCQSILAHSSLFVRYPQLRFDENLRFDLYAEDFSINAQHHQGIEVKIFPLTFQHYSHGNITESYHHGLRYLAQKYPDIGVPGSCSFIGGLADELARHFTYNIRADRKTSPMVRTLRRIRNAASRIKVYLYQFSFKE